MITTMAYHSATPKVKVIGIYDNDGLDSRIAVIVIVPGVREK